MSLVTSLIAYPKEMRSNILNKQCTSEITHSKCPPGIHSPYESAGLNHPAGKNKRGPTFPCPRVWRRKVCNYCGATWSRDITGGASVQMRPKMKNGPTSGAASPQGKERVLKRRIETRGLSKQPLSNSRRFRWISGWGLRTSTWWFLSWKTYSNRRNHFHCGFWFIRSHLMVHLQLQRWFYFFVPKYLEKS